MPKFQINRRSFLMGLVALGASTSLSTPIEVATPAQIDKAWEELGKSPWFFDTNDRTILFQARKFPDELIEMERTPELWVRKKAKVA